MRYGKNLQPKKYPCGKCGKKQLEAEETAMWD